MPSSLVRTVALTSHPETQRCAVHAIGARVSRTLGGMLAVTYIIEGDLDRVRVPAPQPPRVAERLWQHTCCEIFIARTGAPGYYEFNLAPSGEWAVYAFERYRQRVVLDNANELDPQIAVCHTAKKLELNALILLDHLLPTHVSSGLSLALSTVVEDQDGPLSYWALQHPLGKPDFHHPDAFTLALDEIRN